MGWQGPVNVSAGRLLLVVDSQGSERTLWGMLEPLHDVMVVHSGAEALAHLRRNTFDVVILDLRASGGKGLEVIKALRCSGTGPELPVLIVTGTNDTRYLVEALQAGAADYVAKPIDVHALLARIQAQLARKRAEDSLHQAYQRLQRIVSERTAELAEVSRRLERETAQRELLELKLQRLGMREEAARISSIDALAMALEKRDAGTANHQRRVADLSSAIGKELGLDDEIMNGLQIGAAFHDMGKISIPGDILNRAGALNPVEYTLVKTHPQAGYEIMKGVDLPWPVGDMILQHHERIDGSGYPHGLVGEELSLEARIISVADVVESMTAHRPYSPAVAMDAAMTEVIENADILYDPDVVDACRKAIQEHGFAFSV